MVQKMKQLNSLLDYQQHTETVLKKFLKAKRSHALFNAMRYSTLDGGKRLRAQLVYATGEALDAPLAELDVAAAAVEMVHAFSLIHDDLPAMDDDELRRGKPTCHIAFGEATAILAGDALLAMAFDVLSQNNSPHYNPVVRIEMLQVLARATGAFGMTGGQYLDVQAMNTEISFAELVRMHTLKTGCLIRASVELGFLASTSYKNNTLRKALQKFAEYIGLAFQIQDDILDIISDTETLGKTAGKDAAANKVTYPEILGLTDAHNEAKKAYDKALKCLKPLGKRADKLKKLAEMMVWREA